MASSYGDGFGTEAKFFYPADVAISSDGVFALVADTSNSRVRRIALATGMVTTVAGSGARLNVDGIGTTASFTSPRSVSISPDASFALVLDGHRVYHFDIATGAVTTFAGAAGVNGGYADGAGTLAAFLNPYHAAISSDAFGYFALVADTGNQCIRRIQISNRMVTTFAGSSARAQGTTNGAGTSAKFFNPHGVAISPDGSFALITDNMNYNVRHLEISTGLVTTLAGSSTEASTDGTGFMASFRAPRFIAISPDASYVLVTESSSRIRRIALASRAVTTIAGSVDGFADGLGTSALFWGSPGGMAIAPDGKYALVVDSSNQRIRRLILSSPCSAGYECPGGGFARTQCTPGTYAPSASPTCMQCPRGLISTSTGMAHEDWFILVSFLLLSFVAILNTESFFTLQEVQHASPVPRVAIRDRPLKAVTLAQPVHRAAFALLAPRSPVPPHRLTQISPPSPLFDLPSSRVHSKPQR